MKSVVRPELPTPARHPASYRRSAGCRAGVDNSAPSPSRPVSTYQSGIAVQTNRAISPEAEPLAATFRATGASHRLTSGRLKGPPISRPLSPRPIQLLRGPAGAQRRRRLNHRLSGRRWRWRTRRRWRNAGALGVVDRARLNHAGRHRHRMALDVHALDVGVVVLALGAIARGIG